MDSQAVTQKLLSVLPAPAVSEDAQLRASFAGNATMSPAGVTPTHVVKPKDVKELQALIKLANQNRLNLTVASSSAPHFKGGICGPEPSVLIDLSSWQGIEWVNRRNRVCQIQPGVTYGPLLETLKKEGMTLAMPLAPRSGKSVVASLMDREPNTWPNRQWDISDPVASTEFYFGHGDIFRTGAAGGPGTLEQQRAIGGAQKCPVGPSQTDFHRVIQGAQGTMGIVSWITLRTELLPALQKPFLLGANDLNQLIPFVYAAQRPWLGEHAFILNKVAAGLLLAPALNKPFDSLVKSLPAWLALQNICGFTRFPEERVKYQETDLRELAAQNKLEMVTQLGEVTAEELLHTATSPCGETDWRFSRTGGAFSVFFLTTLNRTPEFYQLALTTLAEHKLTAEPMGVYLQPVVQNHACHMEFIVPYNPAAESREQAGRLEKALVAKFSAAGVFFSRPYGAAQEVAFTKNPLNTEMVKKIKTIFDPQKVLNRGKWNL